MRVEQIGGATLILGDCREVAPTLARPAAIISDPPYGQKHKNNVRGGGGGRYYGGGLKNAPRNSVTWPTAIYGDDTPFDPAPWLDAAPIVLLWGAHKFADRLPPGGWIVWDKVPTGKVRDQGDGEAAWINRDMPMRIYRLLWDGVCVGSAARHEVMAGQTRVHPTQKPVVLLDWCIEQARVPADGTIMDPYMGAGSTLVAAVRRGHPCVGIEIEPLYFETALRRVEEAQRQANLFVPAPAPAAASQSMLFASAQAAE